MGAKFASYINIEPWVDYALMVFAAIVFYVVFAVIWRRVFEARKS